MKFGLVCFLLVLPLTGCSSPEGDEAAVACQHIGRNDSYISGTTFIYNRTTQTPAHNTDRIVGGEARPIGAEYLEFDGRPLDRFMLAFPPSDDRLGAYTQDARVVGEVRTAAGRHLDVRDFRVGGSDPFRDAIVFEDGTNGAASFLVDLTHPDAEPAPEGIMIYWTFEGNLDGDLDTTSVVLLNYRITYWYRDWQGECE